MRGNVTGNDRLQQALRIRLGHGTFVAKERGIGVGGRILGGGGGGVVGWEFVSVQRKCIAKAIVVTFCI
jgi:hypothetical protein